MQRASWSYLVSSVQHKPWVALVATLISPIVAHLGHGIERFMPPYLALLLLVWIDFITKIHACRHLGIPVTSQIMREKGLPKLRDYTFALCAGALTTLITKNSTWFDGIVSFLAMWELWSILCENLRDAGTIPVDFTKIPMIGTIKSMATMIGNPATPPHPIPADANMGVNFPVRGPGLPSGPTSALVPPPAAAASDPKGA